ncbi:MAG: polyprenol monophosphomannose synthase [Fibrobacter sp.]|nr:polyprenol monophosphomannose synthase [Fibrobacter sp.]
MAYPKSLVIIPTYNEKENILLIMAEILKQDDCLEILVVDDGSPDGTGDMVQAETEKNPRIHLIRRKGKMGLGTAYVTGFKWALERDYERVFEMDADFSHSPTDLTRFLDAAENGAELVLGSRYQHNRISVVNWDLKRLILSYGANVYTRLVTGLPISDATGGFKCYSRKALQALNLNRMKSDGYCFQIETTFKIWKKGLTVKEIPIVFTDRTRGTSKMSGGIISEAFFLVLKLRLGLA